MQRNRTYHSFGFRLLVSYIVLILVPVMILGFYAYHSSVQSSREQSKANIQGTLKQMKDNVNYQLNDILRVADHMVSDQFLQGFLVMRLDGWTRHDTFMNRVKPALARALELTPLHMLLRLYVHNHSMPEYYFNQSTEIDPLSLPKRYELIHAEQDFALTPAADYQTQWIQTESDRRYGNMTLIRTIYSFSRNEPIGTLALTVKLDHLFTAMNYSHLGEQAALFIYDDQGTILYESSGESTRFRANQEQEHRNDVLEIEESFEYTGWRMVAYIPNELLSRNAAHLRNVSIGVSVASFILLVFVSGIISRYFSKRVTKIVYSMNAFMDGDFLKRIQFRGKDEFAHIAHSFNEMAHNIHELIHEVYLANLQKREAELASLQAQINPHFLYNSLSAISRLAKFGEVGKLDDMVMSLARFYRLSLSKGETIIPIAQEIEHVQTYIQIQKMKYAEGLEVVCEVDTNIYPYHTVKILLQPLVENAIEHAWNGDQLFIHLSAQQVEGNILFSISDDGIGMSEEFIKQIFDREGARIGYGIRNVDDRIKLHFGDAYGITIESEMNVGTTVHILIPAVIIEKTEHQTYNTFDNGVKNRYG